MSIDSPPVDNINTPKLNNTDEVIVLPVKEKAEITQNTSDKLRLLTEDMQNISHADFLQKIDHSERLKYITDPKINSSDIAEKSTIEFNFSFTGEAENRNLFKRTTAGQVLPATIDNLTTADGKEYSRKSLEWEFFAQDGKRLKIYDKTQITIWELRSPEEISHLEKQAAETLKNTKWLTKENNQLLSLGVSKGMNPELILSLFSAFFAWKSFSDISGSMQEDFLTQVDREIWEMNSDEKRADKNNLSDENKADLLGKMGDKKDVDSITYEMWDFPELKILASEFGINKPEFLYAIWELESSCGKNISSRKESRWRESLGMFQILNINLPDTLAYELKSNPSDKDINIRALKHFINNNIELVSAINSSNYEQVASIYNWSWYDTLANKNEWTPYDDKLRNSVSNYYDRMSYNMAA